MVEERDLAQASRTELLAYIAELQGLVAELQARVRELEGRGGGGPKGLPGHKAGSATAPAAETRRPRKKRAHTFARPRLEPTERVVHAMETCPECATRLVGGSVQRRREVIEIPDIPRCG